MRYHLEINIISYHINKYIEIIRKDMEIIYKDMEIIYKDNIIIGAGPAGLQLSYFFHINNIEYLLIEREDTCGSFFQKYPHSRNMISLNKKFTGSDNSDFNLRHDWNSMLNNENHLFTNYSEKFYPESDLLHQYLNDFCNLNKLNINFNTIVTSIDKINETYKLYTKNTTYICKKLIVATGTSIPIIPNFKLNIGKKIMHYSDFPLKYFKDINNLKKYENKKLVIFGSGNSAYELGNILNEYCSSIFIIGRKVDLSMVSHYVGDVRSIYYPFFDTFYLKTLNGIDELDKNLHKEIEIVQITDINNDNYNKYELRLNNRPFYGNHKNNFFDEVIFCTGWKFDSTIFNFNVELTINDKYPKIKYNYESTNNGNLFFIGALMHSHDYRKSSGGFIHGFRYLIKLFTQINYEIPYDTCFFDFDGTMKCYTDLTNQIFKKINISSNLYQMNGILLDVFYYDNAKKRINYINNITFEVACKLVNQSSTFTTVKLTYGSKNYDLKTINSFNKNDPKFLHPEIITYERENMFDGYKLIDTIIIEEDIISDFSSDKVFKKILKTLKGCPLIL